MQVLAGSKTGPRACRLAQKFASASMTRPSSPSIKRAASSRGSLSGFSPATS